VSTGPAKDRPRGRCFARCRLPPRMGGLFVRPGPGLPGGDAIDWPRAGGVLLPQPPPPPHRPPQRGSAGIGARLGPAVGSRFGAGGAGLGRRGEFGHTGAALCPLRIEGPPAERKAQDPGRCGPAGETPINLWPLDGHGPGFHPPAARGPHGLGPIPERDPPSAGAAAAAPDGPRPGGRCCGAPPAAVPRCWPADPTPAHPVSREASGRKAMADPKTRIRPNHQASILFCRDCRCRCKALRESKADQEICCGVSGEVHNEDICM
jgi:hypothetical protein